ncbi:MAG: hypothetical protein K940chlam3_00849 [Chlamydiae bacterium]|nr:hypothetical protein [Chlamydiota bacterium]
MALDGKIERVAPLDEKEGRIDKMETKITERTQPVEGKFETIMDKKLPEQDAALKTAASERPNVEDIAREQGKVSNERAVTNDDLVARTTETSQRIEQIKSELETPNLEIKKPVNRLMRNKLTHIDDSLRIALSKAGTEPVAAPKVAGKEAVPNAATKFFDHLTHAQYQLDHLGSYLQAMVDTDKDLSPANMLAIQVKVNHIQQELEFFTNLLNKSLESTKALMNVQV